MYYYHGTKVKPEIILREGLRPAPINEIVRRVKKDFGVGCEVDPFIKDDIERKRQCLFVYLDSDKDEAIWYAQKGSNFENNLRIEISSYLGLDFDWKNDSGFLYKIELEHLREGEIKLFFVKPIEIIKVERINGIEMEDSANG